MPRPESGLDCLICAKFARHRPVRHAYNYLVTKNNFYYSIIINVLHQAAVNCTKKESGPVSLNEQVAIPELTFAAPCTFEGSYLSFFITLEPRVE